METHFVPTGYSLGRELRAERVRHGLTQRKAARLLGLSESTLVDIERERIQPSAEEFLRVKSIYASHALASDAQSHQEAMNAGQSG